MYVEDAFDTLVELEQRFPHSAKLWTKVKIVTDRCVEGEVRVSSVHVRVYLVATA